MKHLLTTILLTAAAHAGTIDLAWDYPEPDASGLAGFEIRAAGTQGELGGDSAVVVTLTRDATDDNVTIINGETVGFEGSMTLPTRIYWMTVRAYIIDNGAQVFGPSASPIRVVVTPAGIIRVRIP